MSDPLDAMKTVRPTPAPLYHRIPACGESERFYVHLNLNLEEIREGALQEIMQCLPPYQEDSEVDSPGIL